MIDHENDDRGGGILISDWLKQHFGRPRHPELWLFHMQAFKV